MRVDRALAARGLARSRTHAQSLIDAGVVLLDGIVVTRSATDVKDAQVLSLTAPGNGYVSRGALKLLGALEAFGTRVGPPHLTVTGRRCLDAGASTGGFTQVLLERGATSVLALDVGHGQLASTIAEDPRVTSREGVNVRFLEPPEPGHAVDLVVADLSFISLSLVIAPLVSWLVPGGDAVLLVKPQFEVGVGRLGKGGVVRDESARIAAVSTTVDALAAAGLDVVDVARSVVSGADGNVEIFVWGHKTWQAGDGAALTAEPYRLEAQALRAAIEREVKGAS